ncbi:sodium-dependent bicarbonate transport family permease [bacterium]|nr:sodium-dependent bicarbonate transport family permease [bacterium]
MSSLSLLQANLLSPMVLCFGLGIIARFLRSDLRLPESVYVALSTYLLLAIGLKGGVALGDSGIMRVLAPLGATIALGCVVPLVTFAACRQLGRLKLADAGAMAAHYGSVSAVTFIAAQSFLSSLGENYDGFMPALVAVMEIPAIIVGLLLARKEMPGGGGGTLKAALHEIMTGKSVVLLAGGMLIGWATGHEGFEKVRPFFVDPYQGVLCLFLLDMGLHAAKRLRDLRKAGIFLGFFATLGPVLFGTLGVLAGYLSGLNVGGATVLGAMTASASYIAAPAAVCISLPAANPSIYLTAAVGVTFPFNLTVGIPLYYTLARMVFGVE